MSKSKGTFIKGQTYLEHLDAEYLRYYFAAKMSSKLDDFDLNFEDFLQRINSDLVGKLVNIASRTAGFIRKRFEGKLSAELDNPELIKNLQNAAEKIADLFESREYNKAIREIMALADQANQYIAAKAPWQLVKSDDTIETAHRVCTTALNAFRILALYLKPVLPLLAKKAEQFLNIAPLNWQDVDTILLSHNIEKFKPMMQRIEQSSIDDLLAESKQENTRSA